jgi:hypothetical protein
MMSYYHSCYERQEISSWPRSRQRPVANAIRPIRRVFYGVCRGAAGFLAFSDATVTARASFNVSHAIRSTSFFQPKFSGLGLFAAELSVKKKPRMMGGASSSGSSIATRHDFKSIWPFYDARRLGRPFE